MDADTRLLDSLPSEQQALALANAYDLFARLFLEGISAELLPWISAIPELNDCLPDHLSNPGPKRNAAEGMATDLLSADESLQAEHYRLFGLEVFPYQSVFLDAEALLGGAQAEKASIFYASCGFEAAIQGSSSGKSLMPDHIGQELACLAFLCAAEAEAWEDDLPKTATKIQGLLRRLLDELLLPWLPALVLAVQQQGYPFYSALSELTLELALAHRRSLGGGSAAVAAAFANIELGTPESADPAAFLENPKTSLQDIAGFLTTPARCGFTLSRSDLDRLSRKLNLPHGFGDRRQTLENLLRTAADYEKLPELVEALLDLLQEWESTFERDQEEGNPLAAIAATWLKRLHSSRRLLAYLSTAAAAVSY